MIKEKMYEKVQLFKRQGYSVSEISSKLEIDPKTAAKYYVMTVFSLIFLLFPRCPLLKEKTAYRLKVNPA